MSEFSKKLKNAYGNAYDMKNKGVAKGTKFNTLENYF